jgi:methanogenic corrinoid protein MtbC1
LTPTNPEPGDPLLDDLQSHLDVLAAALELGSVQAFAEHTRWSRRVMEARSRRAIQLEQALRLLGEQIASHLPDVGPMATTILEQCWSDGFGESEGGRQAAARTWRSRNIFLKAILEGNRRTALAVCLDAVAGGLALRRIYEEIIQDSMYEVGRLWERNEISVADEHLATAIATSVTHEVFPKIPLPPEQPQGVLVCAPEGEMHQLGCEMLADVLTEAGWRVRFLGVNVPLQPFLGAVRRHEPEVVCLSATLITSLPAIARYVGALHQEFRGSAPSLLLGGQALALVPDFTRTCGADRKAENLEEAVRAVGELMRRNGMRHAASNRLQ